MKQLKIIRENKDGFTLVEVLAVLVIIAILAAVAIPTMTGFTSDAKKKAYTSQARNIYVAAQAAAMEFSGEKAEHSKESYSADDDSTYIKRVRELLDEDVEKGAAYTIELRGSKVEKVEFTPKGGKKITIIGGEGVTYEE